MKCVLELELFFALFAPEASTVRWAVVIGTIIEIAGSVVVPSFWISNVSTLREAIS